MRNVWIVVASALLAFANFVKAQETARNLYSSRYDNLDIDTILGSSRLVNNYVDCLLSRKPCPPEGKDLKRILPEALRTKCSRCSATQKENALKIITTLYYSYQNQYQSLRERWDPSGEYHRRFEEYLRGVQFNQIGSNNANANTNDRPLPSSSVLNFRPPMSLQLQSATNTNFNILTRPSPAVATSGGQNLQSITSGQNPNLSNLFPQSAPVGPNTPQMPATTARTTTTRLILRPVAGLNFDTNTLPTVGVLSNRFGNDGNDESGSNPTMTTVPVPITARPTERATTRPVVRQTTSRIVTQRTTTRFVESAPAVQFQGQFQVVQAPPPAPPQPQAPAGSPSVGMTTPNNIIDNFFIPPGQNGFQATNVNGSPFVGLFNQIGTKIATTADAIAGMLRKTVDVIVTSHLQAHQRALRSYS